MSKRTPRTHDAAIRALRAEALTQLRHAEEYDGIGGKCYVASKRLHAASLTQAADYLASIAGAEERQARRGTK